MVKIFLVEDDDLMWDFFVKVLKWVGYEVKVCLDGEEGLDVIGDNLV